MSTAENYRQEYLVGTYRKAATEQPAPWVDNLSEALESYGNCAEVIDLDDAKVHLTSQSELGRLAIPDYDHALDAEQTILDEVARSFFREIDVSVSGVAIFAGHKNERMRRSLVAQLAPSPVLRVERKSILEALPWPPHRRGYKIDGFSLQMRIAWLQLPYEEDEQVEQKARSAMSDMVRLKKGTIKVIE